MSRSKGHVLFIVAVLAAGSAPSFPAAAAQPAARQSGGAERVWLVEIGAALATPLVEDGNGVTVRTAPGPFVGGQVSLRAGSRLALAVGLRASTATIRVESTQNDWDAGRSQRYEAHVGIETNALPFARLGAFGFAGVISGPRDVIPFRRSGGRLAVWGGDLAATFPIARARHFDLLVAVDGARLASLPAENPAVAAGWVGRLLVGVRRAVR